MYIYLFYLTLFFFSFLLFIVFNPIYLSAYSNLYGEILRGDVFDAVVNLHELSWVYVYIYILPNPIIFSFLLFIVFNSIYLSAYSNLYGELDGELLRGDVFDAVVLLQKLANGLETNQV